MTFKLIDLFAGPGGLGEGFASLNDGKTFKIAVSAEMEASAHKTLTLRSLFRNLKINGDKKGLQSYYDYCNDANAEHPQGALPSAWNLASKEARQLTLGQPDHNAELNKILADEKLRGPGVIVIGGPPCQAYSLMGRAKNRGTAGYVAENDQRHYLYKEYLRILEKVKPIAFVMENVKGILSSEVGGRQVFHDILHDLTAPSKAISGRNGIRYTIHSLVVPTIFRHGDDPSAIDAHDFIVRAEEFGLPQARHRVILLGIREELKYDGKRLLSKAPALHVDDAIKELPALRSKLSRDDSADEWQKVVFQQGKALAADARKHGDIAMSRYLETAAKSVGDKLDPGSQRCTKLKYGPESNAYLKWVRDPKLEVWLNHQARSHMNSDLGRYFYAAAFANANNRSPKGHLEFALENLAPAHANWKTGKFADRFRVQRYGAPSTTVTSHISKDGHYFIHPDPVQCRSLTAREAARLQTFPDNYFFQGNRTQQYHQVGNAVPPFLAHQIADLVDKVLKICNAG
jgi:DNA (cytosine-5)-methyltransferase 1